VNKIQFLFKKIVLGAKEAEAASISTGVFRYEHLTLLEYKCDVSHEETLTGSFVSFVLLLSSDQSYIVCRFSPLFEKSISKTSCAIFIATMDNSWKKYSTLSYFICHSLYFFILLGYES
jgi:hypothetical protein